jgi:hypothetical protein
MVSIMSSLASTKGVVKNQIFTQIPHQLDTKSSVLVIPSIEFKLPSPGMTDTPLDPALRGGFKRITGGNSTSIPTVTRLEPEPEVEPNATSTTTGKRKRSREIRIVAALAPRHTNGYIQFETAVDTKTKKDWSNFILTRPRPSSSIQRT